MNTAYYITGFPFGGDAGVMTPEKERAVSELMRVFWGDERESRVTISISERSRKRCSYLIPGCMGMAARGECTCGSGPFGENEIVITNAKPRQRRTAKGVK